MLIGLFKLVRQLILLILIKIVLFDLEQDSIVVEVESVAHSIALPCTNLLLFFVMRYNIPYGADEYLAPELIVHHFEQNV